MTDTYEISDASAPDEVEVDCDRCGERFTGPDVAAWMKQVWVIRNDECYEGSTVCQGHDPEDVLVAGGYGPGIPQAEYGR